jgi:long-chain fatty acid transport protein
MFPRPRDRLIGERRCVKLAHEHYFFIPKNALRIFLAIALGAAPALVFNVSHAEGSGFYTPDIGAKTVGRGGAWIAGVDDLTAIYLNPAGLAHVKGENLMIVNNFDVFHTAYKRSPVEATVHNRNPVDVIQFAGLCSNFGLRDFTFALGLYGPYSVSESYDPEGPQRYQIVDIQRLQLYYMIGAAWKPYWWLRIGAETGVGEFGEDDVYRFSVFNENNTKTDVQAKVHLEQFGTMMYGLGFQLGPIKGFELGASYQPPNDLKLQGDVYAKLPILMAAVMGGGTYHDKITVETKFPALVRVGARQRITDRLDLEADVVWTGWHRFKEQKISFEKGELLDDYVKPINWQDTFNYRLGGDYALFDDFSLRGGAWYDRSATPVSHLEPGAVEADRWSLCGGAGYYWKGMTLDAAYSHIWVKSASVRANMIDEPELGDPRGSYRGNYDMYLLGMNLNFRKIAASFRRP